MFNNLEHYRKSRKPDRNAPPTERRKPGADFEFPGSDAPNGEQTPGPEIRLSPVSGPQAKPEPEEPFFTSKDSPKKRRKIVSLEQWVEITIDEHGNTVTELFPSNEDLIKDGHTMFPPPELICRLLHFVKGVPPEYDWATLSADRRAAGGMGIQRMDVKTWLAAIAREKAEGTATSAAAANRSHARTSAATAIAPPAPPSMPGRHEEIGNWLRISGLQRPQNKPTPNPEIRCLESISPPGATQPELTMETENFLQRGDMKAAVLQNPADISKRPLAIEDVPMPQAEPGRIVLRVKACGVCRTDLHIVEGELAPKHERIVPGHQIVGEVEIGDWLRISRLQRPQKQANPQLGNSSPAPDFPSGRRVGVSWMGGVDGTCPYCTRGMENLCDAPTFTGYDVNGGYAEYVSAREDFVFPLPPALDDLHAAPLLCAGIIGFRSLRVAGVEHGDRVGLFGFGASAHQAIAVLQAWNCDVYVSTRGESHRRLAESLGAKWVGSEDEKPPVPLDRAITFAPSGDVVVAALSCLRKGGVVAINAIHLDRMPQFDYDRLLWGERQLRSVANMTRADARDFLEIAANIGLRPKATAFPLDQANEALALVKGDRIDGAAVLVP